MGAIPRGCNTKVTKNFIYKIAIANSKAKQIETYDNYSVTAVNKLFKC